MDLRALAARVLPPVTRAVRAEQTKLTAGLVNAISVAAFIGGFLGPYITAIPDNELALGVRIMLVLSGAALHVAARLFLRYMDPKE